MNDKRNDACECGLTDPEMPCFDCLLRSCDHDWMLRPESDTWECLICGVER